MAKPPKQTKPPIVEHRAIKSRERKPNALWLDRHRDAIERMLAAGKTFAAIGEKFDVDPNLVGRYVRSQGLAKQPRIRPDERGRQLAQAMAAPPYKYAEAGQRSERTIYDQARMFLRREGFDDRRLDTMGLSGVMKEANRRLRGWDMEQLGKNEAWLWP